MLDVLDGWPFIGLTARGKDFGAGTGAFVDSGPGFRGALSRAAAGDQAGAPEPASAAWRGEHLCRREPFPGRNSAETDGGTIAASRTGTAACEHSIRPSRGDLAGRFLGVGLRGCRWSRGLLPTGAQGLHANRTALPGLRHPDSEDCDGRTEYTLLPKLPAMRVGCRRIFESRNYGFMKNWPGKFQNLKTRGNLCSSLSYSF